jgi:hypothetical protein
MILLTILIDFILHKLGLQSAGLYLGYTGTMAILISFVYSLRKRRFIRSGSPRRYLEFHEYTAWAGSVMILVHAGVHFNSQLAWLAVVMLLVNVASGLTGKFLLRESAEVLQLSRKELIDQGISAEEADRQLFFDSLIVGAMRKWREIHLPIALIFGILAVLHIFTEMMFAK